MERGCCKTFATAPFLSFPNFISFFPLSAGALAEVENLLLAFIFLRRKKNKCPPSFCKGYLIFCRNSGGENAIRLSSNSALVVVGRLWCARYKNQGKKNGGVDRSRTDLCDFADRCMTVWLPRLIMRYEINIIPFL